jgi:hypothetical protein
MISKICIFETNTRHVSQLTQFTVVVIIHYNRIQVFKMMKNSLIATVGMAVLAMANSLGAGNDNFYSSFVDGVYTEGALDSGDTGMA